MEIGEVNVVPRVLLFVQIVESINKLIIPLANANVLVIGLEMQHIVQLYALITSIRLLCSAQSNVQPPERLRTTLLVLAIVFLHGPDPLAHLAHSHLVL